jgi:hypothetical protein
MANWDSGFENTPASTDSGSTIPARMIEIKEMVRERLDNEHVFQLTEQSSQGNHKIGSARAFVDDADVSNYAPIDPTPHDNIEKGRLQYKPTEGILQVANSGWKALDYVRKTKDTAETIVGAKTMTIAPKISEKQDNEAGTALAVNYDTGKAAKISIVQLLIANATTRAILEALAIPVGYVYIQLKGQAAPWSLWTSIGQLQWTNDTAVYANRFLAGAGAGYVFGTDYGSEVPTHTHGFTVDANATGHDTGIDSLGGSNHPLNTGAQAHFSGTTAAPAGASTDGRPKSTIFQVWRRSS